ncbi:unnamed protein product [Sphenostylis stenocarpa]|uniref:3'-5' exonuclease domain-containing protein n=1 Tax=Sphenostylis stenocarpa TaxID=92480 RepID=A0AA86SKA3_9FABA|nr:unnamed protein product [Sphenostylis stenocarpa]
MASVIDDQSYDDCDIYTVAFRTAPIIITVTVTAIPSVVRNWLFRTLTVCRRYVRQQNFVVGLGVQWTPGHEESPPNTLQLCVGHRCLIFQLDRANYVPIKLRRFLLDPSLTFVGFWNELDRRKLLSSKHRLEMVTDPLDLKRYAENDHGQILDQESVNEIVAESVGLEVDQRSEISTSDWDREELEHDQIVYAAVDAYCAFLFGKNIGAWRFNGVDECSVQRK